MFVQQHRYRPARWAVSGEAFVNHADVRFAAPAVNWQRRQIGGGVSWTAPLRYSLPLGYEVGILAYQERAKALTTATTPPPEGFATTWFMALTWDRYRFHDLTPRGYHLQLLLRPGWLWGPRLPQARSSLRLRAVAAHPLTSTTVAAVHGQFSLFNRGNSNHSALLGSFLGVRGLADAFYRNWTQVFANLELRQAVKLAQRWALQAVLFADGAVFEPMDAAGRPTTVQRAASLGAGLRLLPTWLAEGLLRVDLARLLPFSEPWFVQVGIAQYF